MTACPYCLIFQEERDLAVKDLRLMFELLESFLTAMEAAGVAKPKAPEGFSAMLHRRLPKRYEP